MSYGDMLQMLQGGAHGEGFPQGILGLLSLQPDQPPEDLVPPASAGIGVGICTYFVRAIESRPVKAKTPKVRGRAFQLTTEEVRAEPDIVAGTYSYHTLLRYCVLIL